MVRPCRTSTTTHRNSCMPCRFVPALGLAATAHHAAASVRGRTECAVNRKVRVCSHARQNGVAILNQPSQSAQTRAGDLCRVLKLQLLLLKEQSGSRCVAVEVSTNYTQTVSATATPALTSTHALSLATALKRLRTVVSPYSAQTSTPKNFLYRY